MKKTISLGLGACLLLASASTAQVDASSPPKAPTFKTLEASYDIAKAEYDAKMKVLVKSDEYMKLRKARDRDGLTKLRSSITSPNADFYARFAELAKTQEGTKAEIKTLLWMMGHTRDKSQNAATLEALAERHIKADFWGPRLRAIPYYMGSEKGNALLARLVKENPELNIQLSARHVLANGVLRSKDASEEDKASAKADLDDIVAKHPESLPALQINGPNFVKTRLQIGMEAPEIISKDLDGNDIKLSDYRGKVVVLDFWGDW